MKRIPNITFCALLAAVAALSAGCDESPKSRNPFVEPGSKAFDKATSLSGSVHGAGGPLHSGKVEAFTTQGGVAASAPIQTDGRYTLALPAGTALPLLLTVAVGSGGDGKLEAVAIDPAVKSYDINPLSSAIAAKARALGGYTRQNLTEAATSSVAVPDANKTSAGFRGDPTKQYGGWH